MSTHVAAGRVMPILKVILPQRLFFIPLPASPLDKGTQWCSALSPILNNKHRGCPWDLHRGKIEDGPTLCSTLTHSDLPKIVKPHQTDVLSQTKKSRTSKWWIKCWVPYQATLCSAYMHGKCLWVIQKSRKVIRSTGNELTIRLCCISQHAQPMKQYTWFKFKQSQCIYCQILYVYENKHISTPEHSVKSFFKNRMKIQDKKPHWEMEGLQC